MRELALNAGYELDLSKVPRQTMLDASLQGHYGLNSGFEKIIKTYSKPLKLYLSKQNDLKEMEL